MFENYSNRIVSWTDKNYLRTLKHENVNRICRLKKLAIKIGYCLISCCGNIFQRQRGRIIGGFTLSAKKL